MKLVALTAISFIFSGQALAADLGPLFPILKNADNTSAAPNSCIIGTAATGQTGPIVFDHKDGSGNLIIPTTSNYGSSIAQDVNIRDTGGNTQPAGDTTARAIYVNSIPIDGSKATYSAAAIGFVSAASATDVFTITGSATKTIRITHMEVDGSTTSGSGVSLNLQLIKRSAADTGGTFVTDTNVPHDSNSAAATAVVGHYTANPSLGATVGPVRSERKAFAAIGTDTISSDWDFGTRPSQSVVLRGVAQVLAVNFGATTITGPVIDISIEWTEE